MFVLKSGFGRKIVSRGSNQLIHSDCFRLHISDKDRTLLIIFCVRTKRKKKERRDKSAKRKTQKKGERNRERKRKEKWTQLSDKKGNHKSIEPCTKKG